MRQGGSHLNISILLKLRNKVPMNDTNVFSFDRVDSLRAMCCLIVILNDIKIIRHVIWSIACERTKERNRSALRRKNKWPNNENEPWTQWKQWHTKKNVSMSVPFEEQLCAANYDKIFEFH